MNPDSHLEISHLVPFQSIFFLIGGLWGGAILLKNYNPAVSLQDVPRGTSCSPRFSGIQSLITMFCRFLLLPVMASYTILKSAVVYKEFHDSTSTREFTSFLYLYLTPNYSLTPQTSILPLPVNKSCQVVDNLIEDVD